MDIMLRMGDWMLIESFETNQLELYYLKEDIGERNNMAKENPKVVHQLITNLGKGQESANAQCLAIN